MAENHKNQTLWICRHDQYPLTILNPNIVVAVLEARKLKKMDITGASDPYVKLKLFDSKVN